MQLAATKLPFETAFIERDRGRVAVGVHTDDLEAAEVYFAAHPIELPSGVTIEVDVGIGGKGWYVFPEGTPESARLDVANYRRDAEPEPFDFAQLIGMDVDVAAEVAAGRGWLVRVMDGNGPMTADRHPSRLTVFCGPDVVVISADPY